MGMGVTLAVADSIVMVLFKAASIVAAATVAATSAGDSSGLVIATAMGVTPAADGLVNAVGWHAAMPRPPMNKLAHKAT